MDIGIVSARYAKALFKFAEVNGEAEKVYAEMQTLALAFLKVEALHNVMLNPVLTSGQKNKLLVSAVSGEEPVSESTRKFIALVVDKKRSDLMLFIANAFVALYRRKKGVIKGKLILPVEVGEKIEKRLQQMIEARAGMKLDFDVRIDSEILGGFILEYDTYRLDASLRTQINELHRSLTRG